MRGPFAAADFDGAAEGIVDEAIGDADVLHLATAEAEDRPSRAELAIRHGDELAAAEQRAGIVLTLHVAVGHGDVAGADEVESVVIVVDAIVNANAVEFDEATLDDADGMEGAVFEEEVADGEVLALMQEDVIGTVGAAEAGGRRNSAARRAELCTLAVDGAGAFDCEVARLDGEDEGPVAVVKGGIALQWNGVDGVILLAVGAAKQGAAGGDVQSDVALHLDGADDEDAGGDDHRAALIAIARVDRGLQRRGVERDAVAFGSEIADVVGLDADGPVGGGLCLGACR